MRVPGRYSPVPGTEIDEIPYHDYGPTKPSQQQDRLTYILQWTRRRYRVFLIAAVIWLIYYLNTRLKSSTNHGPKYFNYKAVDWSQYAYSQYATDSAYLCNTLMLFDSLHRLGSRADRILFYPQTWDTQVESKYDRDSQLLILARDKYSVKLMPVDIPDARELQSARNPDPVETWDHSVAKLLAFGETQYTRILHIDSDVTLLKNMDDLFFLPSAPVAMPRAYWKETKPMPLTSMVILLEPSAQEFSALVNASWDIPEGQHNRYDMELLNERYAESALVLPHRPFLLTGELRSKDHQKYLGNEYEKWDADRMVEEASLIHFSDWPLPKPWIMWPIEGMRVMRPKCNVRPGTAEESGCRDREIWARIYDDFRKRRREVCKLLSATAPQWPPKGVNVKGL